MFGTSPSNDILVQGTFLLRSITAKFINAPPNEAPKEHLAALYFNFFTALPSNLQIITIDQFLRWFILRTNFGRMMDPNATYTLTTSEAYNVIINQGDFKFCNDVYYVSLRNSDCVNPLTSIMRIPESDLGYIAWISHEYGHTIGGTDITIGGITDHADVLFGNISFIMDRSLFGLGSAKLQRTTNNDGEFISAYARTNSFEDFADSFMVYIFAGKIFRERAKADTRLQQKYNFLKNNIFQGREYNTGDLSYLDLWKSPSTAGIGVFIDDPNFVWDYQYPTLQPVQQAPAPYYQQPTAPTGPAPSAGAPSAPIAPITPTILESNQNNNCANAVDDDADGKTDCSDSGCFGGSSCQTENVVYYYEAGTLFLGIGSIQCYDNQDNDRDTLTDCADSDCSSICQPTTK